MIVTCEETLIDLGKKSENVTSDELPDLIKKLEQGLAWSAENGRPGVGLAAPQIGIAKKVFIIRIPNFSNFDLNIANAEIKEKYDVFFMEGEGCLSYPDVTARTKRYQEVVIVNNLASPKKLILTGLPAVIAQHEMEHLEGVTFLHNTK